MTKPIEDRIAEFIAAEDIHRGVSGETMGDLLHEAEAELRRLRAENDYPLHGPRDAWDALADLCFYGALDNFARYSWGSPLDEARLGVMGLAVKHGWWPRYIVSPLSGQCDKIWRTIDWSRGPFEAAS